MTITETENVVMSRYVPQSLEIFHYKQIIHRKLM